MKNFIYYFKINLENRSERSGSSRSFDQRLASTVRRQHIAELQEWSRVFAGAVAAIQHEFPRHAYRIQYSKWSSEHKPLC